MDVLTSTDPKQEAANALSSALDTHKNVNVLLLLAGGSALDVLDLVDTVHINEYTTIMMMDERFSTNPTENNFMQMSSTQFYRTTIVNGAHFIESIPENTEILNDFALRIEKELNTYIEKHTNTVGIALFGLGSDGHTAGIFPMKKTTFVDIYGQGNNYVPVIYDKNVFSERCSITPKFITAHITEPFVYAVGEEKQQILNKIQYPHELSDMPAYIHEQINSKIFTDQIL